MTLLVGQVVIPHIRTETNDGGVEKTERRPRTKCCCVSTASRSCWRSRSARRRLNRSLSARSIVAERRDWCCSCCSSLVSSWTSSRSVSSDR
jgi:hypothetical protein